MLKYLKQAVAAVAVVLVAAWGGGDDDPAPVTRNIVQQAQADNRLSILVEAVVAADLATTLSGPGPYTVLAPTDEAFAALLEELGVTKAQLLADRALLTAVLTYHVVPGRVVRAQLPLNTPITTVQGETFTVTNAGVVDQRGRTARLVQTDVPATNGVIHVIDRVILPSP